MTFVLRLYLLVFVVAENVLMAQNLENLRISGTQNVTERPGIQNTTKYIETPMTELQHLNNTNNNSIHQNVPIITTYDVTGRNVTSTNNVGMEPKNTTEVIPDHGPELLNATNTIGTVSVPNFPPISSGTEVTVLGAHDISVLRSFVKSEIVPDVIPVAPRYLLKVVFSGGRNVTLGNKLAPSRVKSEPKVSWNGNSSYFYTLIVVDSDQPSRELPIFRSFLHWCVVNIHGDNVTAGDTLAEYMGAGPSKNSGVHRLTFLVYWQPGFMEFDEVRLSNGTSYGRNGFSVADFALKYNLGDPVSGNFYKTSYDHYVPILYRLIGISNGNVLVPGKIAIASIVWIFLWNVYFYV
ncbi:hypothetical protein O0L34_g15123 [Tuta absoluta]|nr:hypothetical protein O0L34_g15123 [Tuta absoluta]